MWNQKGVEPYPKKKKENVLRKSMKAEKPRTGKEAQLRKRSDEQEEKKIIRHVKKVRIQKPKQCRKAHAEKLKKRKVTNKNSTKSRKAVKKA